MASIIIKRSGNTPGGSIEVSTRREDSGLSNRERPISQYICGSLYLMVRSNSEPEGLVQSS